MPVCYALTRKGRLRKMLYEFHLVNLDLWTCFRNVHDTAIA